MAMVDAFLNKMYRANADFLFTLTRDFVRARQRPIVVLPDDVPAHPYAVAMETVRLASKAEVSLYPWKDSEDHIQQAVRPRAQLPPGVSAGDSRPLGRGCPYDRAAGTASAAPRHKSRNPHRVLAAGGTATRYVQKLVQMSALYVRRDKAALSSGCKAHPAIRSSRKQPEQAWRRRNV